MDTSTSYLGMRLAHPFMAGASPMGRHLDAIKRLEDAGCAAVVLHSVFEEQITLARSDRIAHMDPFDARFADVLALYPAAEDYAFSPDAYVEHIAKVKKSVQIPIIASMNGGTAQSWLTFGRTIEQAGADALELNLYEPVTNPRTSAMAVEDEWIRMVVELKRLLRIPLAVKVSPYFTSMANFAARLSESGADGLVMFNRFYQADIDVTSAKPHLRLELSTSAELPLRLRWMAILYGRTSASLALTGGVATPNDGIKAVLAGADVVQMVSALLRHGPAYVEAMRTGLERWMEWNHAERVDEIRGKASLKEEPDAFAAERAAYIRTLHTWR